MKKLVRPIATVVILVTLGVGIWRLLPGAETQNAEGNWGPRGATKVVIEPIEMRPVETRFETIGTSRAIQSAEIYPAVGGEVTRLAFGAGDFIEKGAPLIELDALEERLAVELAEVRVQDAQRILDRRLELKDTGAVTTASIEEAERLREEARIALGQARIALSDRTVRAPFAGHVGTTDIDVGDRITPTTLITTLDDRSSLLVQFQVPESFVDTLKVGSRVEVSPWASRSAALPAEIFDIGSRIDPTSRTFIARARVANDLDQLRPGQSFRVQAALEGQRYPSVPEVALQWGSDGAYVWGVKDGKTRQISATIVDRQKGVVLIDSELTEGDQVVVEGVQRVREGSEVEDIDASALKARRQQEAAETAR